MSETRQERGQRIVETIAGERSGSPLGDWEATAPGMGALIRDFIGGDVLGREGLDLKTRQLLTVVMLAALRAEDELTMHLRGALRLGWTQREIGEALIQVAPFCGFPASLEALKTFNRLLTQTADTPQ
jgi:4-carboxymuconolactone decarboxylase